MKFRYHSKELINLIGDFANTVSYVNVKKQIQLQKIIFSRVETLREINSFDRGNITIFF